MQKYLYHRTHECNVENILKEGLKRKFWFVSLSEGKDDWKDLGAALFKVDIEAFSKDFPKVVVKSNSPDDVTVWDNIPKEYVELVEG